MGASGFHTLRETASEAGVPLHAQLEVTHRCNLRCRHCYLRGHREAVAPELSLPEIENLLDQLVHLRTLFLALTGGEFFLRSDALAILEAARRREFACTILTNGTLLEGVDIQRVADLAPYQVHVTLLGLDHEHDAVTGASGSFARAVAAMDAMRAVGIRVIAKLMITRIAVEQTAALEAVAREHADAYTRSVELIPTLSEEPPPEDLRVRCDEFCYLTGGDELAARDIPPPWPAEESVCNAGRGLLAVSPYGEVFPCISFRMPMGSIREQALETVWQSPAFAALRRLRRGDLADCQGCADQAYCTFCPGRAWHERGDYTRKASSLCERAGRFRAFLDAAQSPRKKGRA